MFVAESKFLSAPSSFIPHIVKPNPEALLSLIVKPEVEAALLVRLRKKAELYGADWDVSGIVIASEKRKIDAEEVVRLYRDYLIPLTKDVEVRIVGLPSIHCLIRCYRSTICYVAWKGCRKQRSASSNLPLDWRSSTA